LDEGKKLVIDELQIEGKRPMAWKQFLSGYAAPPNNNPPEKTKEKPSIT
jgi:hypothetical protein